MLSKSEVKVTFLESVKYSKTEKVRLFFKDIFNNDVQLDLSPGEFVYSETDVLSNSLKIYKKKGIIKIENEIKPEYLSYYIGYTNSTVENILFLHNINNETIKLESESNETIEEKNKTKNEDVELSSEEFEQKDEALKFLFDLVEKINESEDPASKESIDEEFETVSDLIESIDELENCNLDEVTPDEESSVLDDAIKNIKVYSKTKKKKETRGRPKTKKPQGRPKGSTKKKVIKVKKTEI